MLQRETIKSKIISSLYPPRDPWTHKGQHGTVLVVGGSNDYSGAPALSALAALRAGVDLAYVTGPCRAMDVVASFAPDLITFPWSSNINEKGSSLVLKLVKKSNALIIGGGLSQDEESYRMVREIVGKISIPIVIDAGALRVFAEDVDVLRGKAAVLTPHAGEFQDLFHEPPGHDIDQRIEKVRRAAQKSGAVIVLKGHIDIISDGKQVALNKTGSPFMTKGGTGDTLSGICGALLARGADPFLAAQGAAYLNGKAGERAAKKFGEGMLASDLLIEIPKVIQKA